MPQALSSRPQPQYWIKFLDPWRQDFYPVLGWGLASVQGAPPLFPTPALDINRFPRKSPRRVRNEPNIGGKKVYTKGVFSSENPSASTGKNEVWCVPKSLSSREKEKEYTYTPKSLQGVCGGPLRAVLVYRFWPAKKDSSRTF